ncbi:MAG: cytochrome c oxidase subunit 3, partial [Pseudomonadota bacterium]|nr:cytochrome c oxidase subunit 3 [Pseudomonadota bacterium]
MAHEKNHDYHILTPSIYPFLGSVAAFIMLFGAVQWMHDNGPWMFLIGF